MRRKLEELKGTLGAFLDQREDLLLVVSTGDVEVTYVLKLLEGLDDTSPSDLFLTFSHPFVSPASYVTAVVAHLRAQAPDSTFPALCDDENAPPGTRLRAIVERVSSMTPSGGGHRMIWSFLPLRVGDREGYARLVGDFVPWKGIEPWMRNLRVIARDDRASPMLVPGLRKLRAPGVRIYAMDMSTPALSDALVKEAADRSLPVAERMQALLQLAGLDFAHRRYDQALDKYRVVHNYHAEQGAPIMQAVALLGAGDVLRRKGDLEAAKERYHQALALVQETKALPILLNLTFAIGDVGLELQKDQEAEGFLSLAAQIAGKMMNGFARADALEKQGIARERLGDRMGAVAVWNEARSFARTLGYDERRRSVLTRLVAAYRALGMSTERREAEAELAEASRALEHAAHEAPAMKGLEA